MTKIIDEFLPFNLFHNFERHYNDHVVYKLHEVENPYDITLYAHYNEYLKWISYEIKGNFMYLKFDITHNITKQKPLPYATYIEDDTPYIRSFTNILYDIRTAYLEDIQNLKCIQDEDPTLMSHTCILCKESKNANYIKYSFVPALYCKCCYEEVKHIRNSEKIKRLECILIERINEQVKKFDYVIETLEKVVPDNISIIDNTVIADPF